METLGPDALVWGLLLSAGLLAGFVDAVAGGGGLIALPALLSAGVAPHLALGTNKLAGTFGTASAARAYIRAGIFQPSLWWPVAIATFIGAATGSLLVLFVAAGELRRFLPLAIIVAAVYVAFSRRAKAGEAAVNTHRTKGARALGLGLGFYDGFLGPGTGAFWTSASMALFRLDLVAASGVARFMNFVSNLSSLVTFALLGSVHWLIGLGLGAAIFLGAQLGARSAIRYGAGFIRPIFLMVVALTAARLAWLEWFA